MNGNIETAFIGRVGNDPELKTSAAGKPWTRINVCVGAGDDVQWIKIVCFGETAERLAGQIAKGDKIYCEGTLRLETWKGHNGNERHGLSVTAWRAEKLGAIGRNKPPKSKPLPEGDHPAPVSTEVRHGVDLDAEIPF